MISFRRQTSEVNMLSPPDTQWMTTNKMTYTAPITQNQRYKSFMQKGVNFKEKQGLYPPMISS